MTRSLVSGSFEPEGFRSSVCPGCVAYSCKGVGPVWGHGPVPSRVMVVGEAPAAEEVRRGRPFVGESGMELDFHYLPLAGLRREMVYVTNASKCSGRGCSNPSPSQVRTCRSSLEAELAVVRPKVVVALGGAACSALGLSGDGFSVPRKQSIPHVVSVGGWVGFAIPVYHPAAGMRDGRYILPIENSFRTLRRVLDGDYDHWLDRFASLGEGVSVMPCLEEPEVDCRECRPEDLVGSPGLVAVDTESDLGGDPVCLAFSDDGRVGKVIFAGSPLIGEFCRWLSGSLVILHNAIWDLQVLDSMGVKVSRYVDTMIMARVLCLPSAGLKELSWSLLGLNVEEYESVVERSYRKRCEEWLEAVSALSGLISVSGGSGSRSKFRSPRPKRSWLKDPPPAIAELIPPPVKDITCLSGSDLIRYCGTDAVVTFLVYRAMMGMMSSVRVRGRA